MGSSLPFVLGTDSPDVQWGRHSSGGAGFSTRVNEPMEAQSPAEVLRSHVSAAFNSTEPLKGRNGGRGGSFYAPGAQWGIHTSDTV